MALQVLENEIYNVQKQQWVPTTQSPPHWSNSYGHHVAEYPEVCLQQVP
jgi:hypothetical protein